MDGDAIKSFFAHHVEKFILGLIAATAIFLIYSGTKRPDYMEKTQPERLQEDARTVKQSIDDDHTEAIVEELPSKEVEKYADRVARVRNPIPAGIYGPTIYIPRASDSLVQRQDPELFAPIDLQVRGVLGALAMKNPRDRTSYPAMELEDADPIEAENEPKERSTRRPPRRGRGGGATSPEEMYGSPEMAGPPEMYDGAMGSPEGVGGTARQRRLNSKYNEGYKLTSGGMTGGGIMTGGGGMTAGRGARGEEAPLKAIPQSSIFIAGTAAVPHKKLLESYKSALLDAAGYQAQRDRPLYAGFEVQRADVTGRSLDQLNEDDWLLIGDWEQHNDIALYQWDGFGAEIVPGDYRDPRLTAVIPPLLVYDFTQFVLHPLIPLKSLREIAQEKLPQRPVQQTIEGPILPGRRDDDTAASRPGQRRSGLGPMGSPDAMGPAGAMGPMGTMSPMGFAGGSNAIGDPEYKLVRFYDFYHGKEGSAKPGREYVYRVRIGLEDPNFPKSPMAQPPLHSLADDVFARVDPKRIEFEKTRERNFIIYSDWSDPSPAVSLPKLTEVFAGPVEPASIRGWDVAGKSIDYIRSPAQGKAVGMRWDWGLATNVPASLDVTPGTVLNAKQPAEVIDPLTTVIKKTEERDIVTDITIVDLAGGELLQIVEETEENEEMTAPGTMLIFDPDGGLFVRDDIDDLQGYRMHTFADDREAAKPAPSSMDDGAMPSPYSMEMGP